MLGSTSRRERRREVRVRARIGCGVRTLVGRSCDDGGGDERERSWGIELRRRERELRRECDWGWESGGIGGKNRR